jgi:hypothetical protein
MKVTRNVIGMKMVKAEEANTSMTMEQAIREVELKKLRDKHGINRSFVNPASHLMVAD